MKKLLILVLGMVVFTACTDFVDTDKNGDGSGGNGGGGNTSLIEITVLKSNLGEVTVGSKQDVKLTVKNKSTTEKMKLYLRELPGSFVTTTSLGTCTIVNGATGSESYITQNSGATCTITYKLTMLNTETSPLTLKFKDANGDNIDVVIVYTIAQSTNELETPLIKITPSKTNLGSVKIGSKQQYVLTVQNKSTTDKMKLYEVVTINMSLIDIAEFGSCHHEDIENDMYLTQQASATCNITFNLVMKETLFGSPLVINFKDANGDKLSVVLNYTLTASDTPNENLTTSLIKITPEKKTLDTVAIGSKHTFTYTIENLDKTDKMVLTMLGYRNGDLVDKQNGIDIGNCKQLTNEDPITIGQDAGATCTFTHQLVIKETMDGSPFAVYFQDANGTKLNVVLNYTIE